MKVATVLTIVATATMATASPGGYLLKGGVVDFQRPLDYKDAAVKAGKFAWNQRYEQELEQSQGGFENVNSKREASHQYIPTFFTSQENHDALTSSGQIRNQREAFNQPLYYETYHNRK